MIYTPFSPRHKTPYGAVPSGTDALVARPHDADRDAAVLAADLLELLRIELRRLGHQVGLRPREHVLGHLLPGQRVGDQSVVAVKLPVFRSSPTADSPTIQVWSTMSTAATGVNWLVAHNDPDRAAGYWAGVTWPAGQVRAVVSYMAACNAILRDSGISSTHPPGGRTTRAPDPCRSSSRTR